MRYNKFGQTGLKVSHFGVGALQLQFLDIETTGEILKTAFEQGINFIETGRVYQDSEDKIGLTLKKFPMDFIIASKTMQRSKEKAQQDIALSLEKLKMSKIHIYQLHMVNDKKTLQQVTAPEGALEALKEAKADGKIDHIGISGHDLDILKEAIDIFDFESVQFSYNAVEHENAEIIPILNEKGIGKISMKPLAGGNIGFTNLALKFILAQDIDTVVVGMNSPDQLMENIKAWEEPIALTPAEEEELVKQVESLGKTFCRNCAYCQCPQDINIRQIFMLDRMWNGYGGRMKQFAARMYSMMPAKPDICDECETCESICPYHLPIIEKLKDIHERMSTKN